MSTFLDLFIDLHRESGAAGAAPTTTVGQAAEYLRLRNWVIQADHNIQTLWHDFKFLVDHDFTYDTVVGVQIKTVDTTWQRWDHETFKLDNEFVDVEEYENVKSEQFFMDVSDRGTPWRIIIRPNGALQFDPVPDDVYTITADHWLKPVMYSGDVTGVVADDIKLSKIPTQYHPLILAQALKYYAAWENSEDAMLHANLIWGTDAEPGMYLRFLSAERPNAFSSDFSNRNIIEVIAQ